MTRLAWRRGVTRAAYFLATLFLLVVASRPAAAQGYIENSEQDRWTDENGSMIFTEVYAIILGSTTQSEIYTEAETYTTYNGQWYHWDVEAEGDLYCDSQQIDSQDDTVWGSTGSLTALVSLTDPVEVGHWYTFYGYHFIDYDEDYLGDPDDPVSGEYSNWTLVAVYAGAPSISSINPTSASIGTSGSIEVNGGNLVDPFNCGVSPALTGGNVQLTSDPSNSNNFIMESGASCDATVLTIDYSIGSTASSGNQTFTLANRFGTSNGMTFTVYDPSPSIDSISPPSWQAGWINRSVTITGTGFGTSPTVSVSDPSVTCTVGGASDTSLPHGAQLTASCSVAASDANSSATVTVTSHGYNGSGFVPNPGGGTSNASDTVGIVPLPVTPPQIYQGPNTAGDGICSSQATNITNTQQQVLVGQQIAFTACIPSMQLAQQTMTKNWTMPNNWSTGGQPAAVGNWTVTNPSGCSPSPPANYCNYTASLIAVPTGAPGCGGLQSCDFYTFYFVVPGTYTFTYSYTAPGGYAQSSVTYVASGPTNVNVGLDYGVSTHPFMPVTIYADNNNQQQPGVPTMGLGSEPQVEGLHLVASFTFTPPPNYQSNPNSTSFVQVFSQDKFRVLASAGTYTGYITGYISPTGEIYTQVLDNYYPYISGSQFYDDPNGPVQNDGRNYSEYSRNYSATLYLMWDPALPQGCTPAARSLGNSPTPSQCTQSIPVPLGTVSWGACGDAINTLVPQGAWTDFTLACSSETQPNFVSGTAYPSWQSTSYNSEPIQLAAP